MNTSQKTLTVICVTLVIVMAEFALSSFAFLLPTIKASFSVSDLWLEHCFSFSVLSLGLAGLVYGLLADGLGRKPLFLVALVILCLSSCLAYVAKAPQWFMLARILQSVGAGAAWVVGNACLGDVFEGEQYNKVMNLVHAIAGLVPAFSPIIVTVFLMNFSWQSLYLVFALFAFALVMMIGLKQKESLIRIEAPVSIVSRFKTLILNHTFSSYTWIKSIAVGMMFAVIAQLPLICVEHYHVSTDHLWVTLLPLFASYIVASSLSAKLSQRIESSYFIMVGLFILAASSLLLVLAENSCSFAFVIGVISCLFFGFGCVFGNATAKIVSAVPGLSGLASALMICAEMIFSSLFVYVLAFYLDESFFPLAIFLVITTFLSFLPFFFAWIYKHEKKIFS